MDYMGLSIFLTALCTNFIPLSYEIIIIIIPLLIKVPYSNFSPTLEAYTSRFWNRKWVNLSPTFVTCFHVMFNYFDLLHIQHLLSAICLINNVSLFNHLFLSSNIFLVIDIINFFLSKGFLL